MSNEAPFQINLKTPGGTLLNIRAWTEQELDIYIDALQLRIPDIQTLEQVVNSGGAANLNLNQSGTANQVYSIQQSCVNAAGCNTTISQ